jgi:hypothetical protein
MLDFSERRKKKRGIKSKLTRSMPPASWLNSACHCIYRSDHNKTCIYFKKIQGGYHILQIWVFEK